MRMVTAAGEHRPEGPVKCLEFVRLRQDADPMPRRHQHNVAGFP